ncbi:MAG TPA: hypothetical protein VKE22_05085 [Haliangiales bacterium]|nr:hypothetical protein [Haliangiales bacterium]
MPRPRWLDAALLGRSFIVLGIGYLLRAITDLPVVPDAVGAGVGLAFAAALLVLADRAGARGRPASSACHGATALIVAYPLVAELVARYALIGAAGSAALVVAFSIATMVVAARRRVVALAWIVTPASLLAIVALATQTGLTAPHAAAVVALTAASAWLARRLRQRFLVWPVAIASDLVVLLFASLVVWGRSAASPWGAAAIALLFFGLCAGGTMARAVRDGTATTPWENLQASAAFVVGLVPAARISAQLAGGAFLGLAMLALGVAGEVLALRAFSPQTAGRTLAFWTSLWLAVVVVSLAVVFHGPALALVELAPAAAMLIVVRRREHPAGELQALATIVVAAAVSGALDDVARALTAPPPDVAAPGPIGLAVLMALVVAVVRGIREPPRDASLPRRAAKMLAVLLGALSVAGLAAGLAAAILHPSFAAMATIRTGILSLSAVALALVPRRSCADLVYPLLALIAIKIGVEDLRHGVAATLFVSLGLFGLTLILAPRFRQAGT